jgi:hypothetical protein
LAIITMQMMPKISCPHRVASDAVARVDTVVAVVVDIIAPARTLGFWSLGFSLLVLVFYRARSDAQSPNGMAVMKSARTVFYNRIRLAHLGYRRVSTLDFSSIDNPSPDAIGIPSRSPIIVTYTAD